MISLVAFIITLIGALNWFLIGIFQTDIIALIFGSQSAVMSRIIYAIVGLASFWLIYAIIAEKGKIDFKKNYFKKAEEKDEKIIEEVKADIQTDFEEIKESSKIKKSTKKDSMKTALDFDSSETDNNNS